MLIVNYLVDFANDMAWTSRHKFTIKTPQKGIKYILSWQDYYLIFSNGQSLFPKLNCPVNNCEFTQEKYLLNGDYKLFDAILFSEKDLNFSEKPKRRGNNQLYIFTTIESSFAYPACELYNDEFFNWTFTFRLDSTIRWHFFVVRNTSGAVIAPDWRPNWSPIVDPIRPEIKAIISGKKRAGAWLVSHCTADSQRDEYMARLQDHLFAFSLRVDVYGSCSQRQCSGDDCESMLRNDYYFYMAFENGISEDYVSEKVLHGYNNYAVPVVYGGANYSR